LGSLSPSLPFAADSEKYNETKISLKAHGKAIKKPHFFFNWRLKSRFAIKIIRQVVRKSRKSLKSWYKKNRQHLSDLAKKLRKGMGM